MKWKKTKTEKNKLQHGLVNVLKEKKNGHSFYGNKSKKISTTLREFYASARNSAVGGVDAGQRAGGDRGSEHHRATAGRHRDLYRYRSQQRTERQAGMIPRGIVIGTLLGNVQYLSMSPDDGTVAACTDAKIYMLNSKYEEVFTILKGHLGSVTAAEFCSWQPDILVSVSEDRTFKVWNQINGEVLYQSSVLSASPLLSLCISEEHKQLITGSGDGQVWVFSLLDGQQYRLVIQVDLQKTEQRYLRNMELKQKQLSKSASPTKNTLGGEERMETTKPVLRITPYKHFPVLNEEAISFSSMNSFNFWIGSSDSLQIINLATSEIEAALHFKGFLPAYFNVRKPHCPARG
ncbi:UNVERIFIED_CONTAM: hypothetical protein FKN15_020679 [Acipenser sinensis]